MPHTMTQGGKSARQTWLTQFTIELDKAAALLEGSSASADDGIRELFDKILSHLETCQHLPETYSVMRKFWASFRTVFCKAADRKILERYQGQLRHILDRHPNSFLVQIVGLAIVRATAFKDFDLVREVVLNHYTPLLFENEAIREAVGQAFSPTLDLESFLALLARLKKEIRPGPGARRLQERLQGDLRAAVPLPAWSSNKLPGCGINEIVVLFEVTGEAELEAIFGWFFRPGDRPTWSDTGLNPLSTLLDKDLPMPMVEAVLKRLRTVRDAADLISAVFSPEKHPLWHVACQAMVEVVASLPEDLDDYEARCRDNILKKLLDQGNPETSVSVVQLALPRSTNISILYSLVDRLDSLEKPDQDLVLERLVPHHDNAWLACRLARVATRTGPTLLRAAVEEIVGSWEPYGAWVSLGLYDHPYREFAKSGSPRLQRMALRKAQAGQKVASLPGKLPYQEWFKILVDLVEGVETGLRRQAFQTLVDHLVGMDKEALDEIRWTWATFLAQHPSFTSRLKAWYRDLADPAVKAHMFNLFGYTLARTDAPAKSLPRESSPPGDNLTEEGRGEPLLPRQEAEASALVAEAVPAAAQEIGLRDSGTAAIPTAIPDRQEPNDAPSKVTSLGSLEAAIWGVEKALNERPYPLITQLSTWIEILDAHCLEGEVDPRIVDLMKRGRELPLMWVDPRIKCLWNSLSERCHQLVVAPEIIKQGEMEKGLGSTSTTQIESSPGPLMPGEAQPTPGDGACTDSLFKKEAPQQCSSFEGIIGPCIDSPKVPLKNARPKRGSEPPSSSQAHGSQKYHPSRSLKEAIENLNHGVETQIIHVRIRPLQPKLRNRLLEKYAHCLVTGCARPEVLEAAHITSAGGSETYREENGLVLRVDLHRLFDKGMLIVLPTYELVWHPDLYEDPVYGSLTQIARLVLSEDGDDSGLPERDALACKAINSIGDIMFRKKRVDLYSWGNDQLKKIFEWHSDQKG